MPPLGRNFFRAVGTQVDNAPSSVSADENIKPLISQEDLELEYLNEISRLTREKEEARDEVDRCVRDSERLNSSLLESNASLLAKVSELEKKLESQSSNEAQSNPKDLQITGLKEKLSKYHETNKILNAKVQRLKQRRKDGEDFSDVSSVGSMSLISTTLSSYDSRIAGFKHSDISELQTKYDNELARNRELEQKIRVVEASKENSEKLLEELKIQSTERIERHKTDMEKLQHNLAISEESIAKLELFAGERRDEVEDLRGNPLHEELESHKKKIINLEKEIDERKEEIKRLKSMNENSTDDTEKVQILKETVKQLEEEKEKNEKEIVTLQKEQQINLSRLKSLEVELQESKTKYEKVQEEVERLKNGDTILDDREQTLKTDGLWKEKEKEITELNEKVKVLTKEKEEILVEHSSLETALAMTKLKNAQLMEQVDLLESKSGNETQDAAGVNKKDRNQKFEEERQINKNKIAELQQIVKEKEMEMKSLKADSTRLATISERVMELEKQLENKTNELVALNKEKTQSVHRLETLEMDFIVTQQKGAKTWEELEDLKEKFEHEQHEKEELKTQLKRMDTVDQLVDETKRLSEATLKERDLEIEKLKRLLTEANVAKGATERKLVAVMNDTVAQESSRQLMRQELEEQLDEENEKAKQLEALIKIKEEDIEKVRLEFSNLATNMQNEMDKKRSQITELNGEILEKSNLLNEKDRDVQFLKGEIDDIHFRHESEVKRLKEELSTSVDKVELEKLWKHNSNLEFNILTLNQEIGKLRAMFVNQPVSNVVAEDATVKILRTRNEQLKNDIEKLTLKLRQRDKGSKWDNMKRIDTMKASNSKRRSHKSSGSKRLSRRDSGREEI